MRGGAVGVLDLGAVSSLSASVRRCLCQLYEALARCERSDAAAALTGAATSAASDAAREAELKALLEALGLAIDLPDSAEPLLSSVNSSSTSSSSSGSSSGGAISYYEIARALFDPRAVRPASSALTTAATAATSDVVPVAHPLDCLQWGGLLRGASIKRVPKEIVPVLRMVAPTARLQQGCKAWAPSLNRQRPSCRDIADHHANIAVAPATAALHTLECSHFPRARGKLRSQRPHGATVFVLNLNPGTSSTLDCSCTASSETITRDTHTLISWFQSSARQPTLKQHSLCLF
eukprot:1848-Heterococcus_DN1.PRE.1